MVYVRENPTKMDDDWGYPYFRKPPFMAAGWGPSSLGKLVYDYNNDRNNEITIVYDTYDSI